MENNTSTRPHFACCAEHSYRPYTAYCPKCDKWYCSECISEPFCPACNTSLIPASVMPPLFRRSIAVLLAFLGGPFGLHLFYIGRTTNGVLFFILSSIAAFFALSSFSSILFIPAAFWLFVTYIFAIVDTASGKTIDKFGRPLV